MQLQPDEPRWTSLPDEIDSPQTKLVYLCLRLTDGATATELQELLSLRKSTVLSVLGTLSDRDLVSRTDDGYVPA